MGKQDGKDQAPGGGSDAASSVAGSAPQDDGLYGAVEDVVGAVDKVGDWVLDMENATQTMPLFVVAQCLVVFMGWTYTAFRDGTEAGGLESLYPGWTDLALTQDCEDYRPQVYRWLSYQFSHANFTHVFTNSFLLLL